jgi:hypothetical protein
MPPAYNDGPPNAVRFAIHLHRLYHQNLVFVQMRQKRRVVRLFFVT